MTGSRTALVAFKILVGVIGIVVGGFGGYFVAAATYELLVPDGQFGYEFEGLHFSIFTVICGAIAGWFAGFRAGGAALARGSRGLLVLASAVAFLVCGSAGATAAVDAWQRRHLIVKQKQTPYECRHDPPYPRYCRGAKPYIVRHPARDIPGWHAAAGGFAGGSAGALTVSTAGWLLLRRREGRHPTRPWPRAAADPAVDDVPDPIVAGRPEEAGR